MHPIVTRCIGISRWVFAVVPLRAGGANINGLAIFTALGKGKIQQATSRKGGVSDFIPLGKIAQAQTFTAGILKAHVEHTQPAYTLVYAFPLHI